MIMYEQDSDVIRWGLDILNCYPPQNPGYLDLNVPNDTTYYSNNYDRDTREASISTNNSTVENDEIIAHALQEELEQLAVAEASGTSHTDQDNSQASVLTQDWIGTSVSNYDHGGEDLNEEVDNMEPSTSCSSPGEKHDEELSLELSDDFIALDGEVGKRLNQLVPTTHIPRINRDIPSIDEATSDHERLLERLRLYNLVELKVQGDGNCQFRALSDQFYRSTEHHKFVRQQVVTQLNYQPEIYEGYVPMAYGDYLKKISKNGEWGDHVTLQAAADSYGVKIFVITSFKDTCYIEIIPNVQKSKRVIFLSFWAEVHYNSIYPEGKFQLWIVRRRKDGGLSKTNIRDSELPSLPTSCTLI